MPADRSGKKFQSLDCPVGTFFDSRRIGIIKKASVKDRIQNAVNCLMDNSILDRRFMDNSRFGIANLKLKIWAMLIQTIF